MTKNVTLNNIKDLDSKNVIWDHMYDKWHKRMIENINSGGQENDYEKRRCERAKEALISKEEFINIFKKDEKFRLYWFDYLIK